MKARVLFGDVYPALKRLKDNSVKVAITSPPYYRQRDYGFVGQIGQEETPEEYLGRLVEVFSLLRRKLMEDGVFFLNVGDKYHQRYGKSHLLQLPYRLAHHMVKEGWKLLDILIWYKPNHMPSPVRDRFANTYEPIFVFAKSDNNAYVRRGSILKVPLQPTPWKHTAVFPERLVLALLNRVSLKTGDVVLDPFAGTGTVGYVAKRYFPLLRLFPILIEKGEEYLPIISERLGDVEVVEVPDEVWRWKAVEEEDIPDVPPRVVNTDRYGEMVIAKDTGDFLRLLRGTLEREFITFHREDALYIFGVKENNLKALYYPHALINHGYTLRNMLVVEKDDGWYPLFLFARASTRVPYRFFLDRVRRPPAGGKVEILKDAVGIPVKDTLSKSRREGKVKGIISRYPDGHPRLVIVEWEDGESEEMVLHPSNDEEITESLTFACPKCGFPLPEPYDPLGENVCPSCGAALWRDIGSTPVPLEPVLQVPVEISEGGNDKRRPLRSKYRDLSRINWGASPAARKAVLGEYFTRIRLYKVPQPVVATYLQILRRERGLSIKDVVSHFPPSYRHTVGHWFRKDFGGSIPRPEDIRRLISILGDPTGLLNLLLKAALKLQTVKAHTKGRNPGDFWREEEIHRLVLLYRPNGGKVLKRQLEAMG